MISPFSSCPPPDPAEGRSEDKLQRASHLILTEKKQTGFRLAWLTAVRHLAGMTAILLLLVSLSACGTSKDDKDADKTESDKKTEINKKKEAPLPICPQVAILRDLETMKDYGTEKPDPSELVGQAKMLSIDGECGYTDEGIDVKFNLNMAAAKGPRLGGLHISFPYFIAVVAPDETILNKNKMTAEFGFSSDSKITQKAESLHVFIPLPKDKRSTGPEYRVLTGFQLDEDQLSAIRSSASTDRGKIK